MEKQKLRIILADQKEDFLRTKELINRDVDMSKILNTKQIVLISGIRRCGKSTLLKLIHNKLNKVFLYFNFTDERIVNFTSSDFNVLYEIFLESNPKDYVFYFDEIQEISGWEKFLNRMHEKGIKIFVTGSNAKLLSSEIATALTGRNIVIHLSPFSFKEFLDFRKIDLKHQTTSDNALLMNAFQEYLSLGGFPLIIKEKDSSLIQGYYSDIFYRDIVARYKLQNIEELKILSNYLISSSGRDISYSKMAVSSGISSKSLVKKYLQYFLNSYLFIEIKKFDYSYKKQVLNPRKFYPSDIGFLNEIGFKTSYNNGAVLENLVLLNLIYNYKEVFYHKKKNECNFLIKQGLTITKAIQVCYNITDENKKREIDGLIEAMQTYNLNNGLILTYEQEEILTMENKKIVVKPVWKWLLE
jgi:predicted AAA+ superfamily ATPase